VPRTTPKLPSSDQPFVAVLSGEMPPPIDDVARHAWIIARLPGDPRLHRYEYLGSPGASITDAPFSHFSDGDVAIHGIVTDDVERIVACLERETPRYDDEHPTYFPIPGPNSNTFVDGLLRRCGIHVELPSTCIGRDYRGPIGVSTTETGTGVQLETWFAGVRLGLVEGVEAHAVGLALGAHLVPPAITVPVNPGRIGFGDGAHMKPQVAEHAGDESPFVPEVGIAQMRLFARHAHVRRSTDAGGLAERTTLGLSGRAIWGKRVGYAFGLDLELGAGFPLGFAYGVHLHPAGIGLTIDGFSFIMLTAGFGTSGVTARVPSALELPVELRAEIDAGPRARVMLRAGLVWIDTERSQTRLSSFVDETFFGAYARFGRRSRRFANGTFFGLERRDLMDTYWLAFVIGSELDAAR
jgi:hypothetical protein